MTMAQDLAFEERLREIGEPDIAWFAGWLSADGSIMDAGQGRPRLRFVITDRDPLDRLSALFGGAVYGPIPATGLGRKPRYEWQISGVPARLLLERALPWLSVRYAERAYGLLGYDPEKGKALTRADVASIREELALGGRGTGRRLARKYGVSDGLISAIKHGRVWSSFVSM